MYTFRERLLGLVGTMLTLPFEIARHARTFSYSLYYRNHCQIGKNSRLLEGSKILNAQRNRLAITIGENSTLRGELFLFAHAGRITVGDYCYVGEGSRIWSSSEVRIGNRVLISHNVEIHDCISHPIDAPARHMHFKTISLDTHPKSIDGIRSAPVCIDDDVWIGFGATILKGVHIGERSIIAAGSLVTTDVPQDVIVGGRPAVVIRNLVGAQSD